MKFKELNDSALGKLLHFYLPCMCTLFLNTYICKKQQKNRNRIYAV